MEPDKPATAPPPAEPRRGWIRGLFAFFGIVTTPAARWHVRIRPRFFAFLLAGFVVLIGGLFGMAAWSTSPSFCRSCHLMEPYYQAWAGSKHKDVPCVECHYPPGKPQTILWKKFQALSQVAKFVTRTYSSKPYAEVEDASCLRSGCHSTRLLQGRVVSQKGILFDHRPHLEGVRYGRQLRCTSCHSQLVVGKHIEVTWDTCFLCHLKGHKEGRNIEPIGGCQGCHLLPTKPVQSGNVTYDHKSFLGEHKVACQNCHQDVLQGEGDVPQDRCLACHNEPEKLARIGDIPFLHDNHVTKHNTACFHCHKEIKHAVAKAGTKPLEYDCKVCHTDTHDLQRSFYMGIGAQGVAAMPSPMYLANVDCVGCHVEKLKPKNGTTHAQTFGGTEKGCLDCHGKEYTGILEEVHVLMRETVTKLGEKQAAFEAGLAGKAAPPEVTAALAEAKHNLTYVSHGHTVHNIYYAAQVLRYTDQRLSEAARTTQVEVPDLGEMPVISGAFCATLCHGKVGVKVPAETVKYKGKDLPHQTHIENVGSCTSCHVFGAHKDVKLREDAPCLDCHEESDLSMDDPSDK
ncbi:MAG: NapC/NirT family cytochrome c [Planctomycetota bacterium]